MTFKGTKRKVLIYIAIPFLFIIGFIGIGLYQLSDVTLLRYSIRSPKIVEELDGYRIALITDFHNSNNYKEIEEILRKEKPNIICISGDLVSKKTVNYQNTRELLRALVSIAPTYYSYGNHEVWGSNPPEPPKARGIAKEMGCTVLTDETIEIGYKGSYFNLTGFGGMKRDDKHVNIEALKTRMSRLYKEVKNKEDRFNILMFHRAQYFEDVVSEAPYDLMLSGHIHNGLINLPIIKNWILKRNFGTTKYTKGLYSYGDSQMVLSGGLSKDILKPRILNTPEVVIITLRQDNQAE